MPVHQVPDFTKLSKESVTESDWFHLAEPREEHVFRGARGHQQGEGGGALSVDAGFTTPIKITHVFFLH